MTSTSLNYHPESHDMPSSHVHSNPGTCDMPSSHMLPTIHEMYNMPSSCTVSPETSGYMMLTCTIPLTHAFPVSLSYERKTYIRHMFPLKEEEHMQDSHAYIMDLEDPRDYPSPALHDICKATPTDNPSHLPYGREAYTRQIPQ